MRALPSPPLSLLCLISLLLPRALSFTLPPSPQISNSLHSSPPEPTKITTLPALEELYRPFLPEIPLLSPLSRSAKKALTAATRSHIVVGQSPERLAKHPVSNAVKLRLECLEYERLMADASDTSPAKLSLAAKLTAPQPGRGGGPPQTFLQINSKNKLSLAVEGGGMRGCVSAGMITALDYLGMRNVFDEVTGSSAGSLVGAYFIAGQMPWWGPEVYYDKLTNRGSSFIDTKRLTRSIGLGLLDPRLIKDVLTRRGYGKPVFNLDYLLKEVVKSSKPLDFEKFDSRQSECPLRIVASGLRSEKAVILEKKTGNFETLDELTECMWASMLLPGIAGPPVRLNKGTNLLFESAANGPNAELLNISELQDRPDEKLTGEPLADALLYEPLPYRSSARDGATHTMVLRTRPDGVNVLGRASKLERMIMRRFFRRKLKLDRVFKWMALQCHKMIYAEDVIILNESNVETEEKESGTNLMCVALAPGNPEITRMETRRDVIFDGVKRGFARAYDALVEEESEIGRGWAVACEVFPDAILEYDPEQCNGWAEFCAGRGEDPYASYKGARYAASESK